MIGCVGRALRLSLAVAAVSVLGFAASSANAQFVGEDVCASPEGIVDNFDDSGNWADFSDVSNCTKICKSYINKCKAFSKGWHSCAKKAVGDEAELDRKAFCDTLTDKADKKECKESVNADEKADKEDVKGIKDELVGICDEILDDCISVCENPVP